MNLQNQIKAPNVGFDSFSNATSTITSSLTDVASGNFVGLAQTGLSMIGIDPIGGINDIISNGFNLSCYNATHTPSKVSKMIQEKNEPQIQLLLNKIYGAKSVFELEKAINDYSITIYNNHQFYKDLISGHGWSSCSKEGLSLFVKFYAKLIDNFSGLLSGLTTNYQVAKTDVNSMTIYPQGGVYWDTQSVHDNKPFVYTNVKLTAIVKDNNTTGSPIVITDPVTGEVVSLSDSASNKGGSFPWWILGIFLF